MFIKHPLVVVKDVFSNRKNNKTVMLIQILQILRYFPFYLIVFNLRVVEKKCADIL
jgi:hypothetical protein